MVTCRSCLHATPVDGGWHCARHDAAARSASSEQRAACARHLFIPDLVPGEVVDAGDDHVVYRMRDGSHLCERRAGGGIGMLTLRPYQQAAIDAVYGYFAGNAGHPLVVIPTAGGKSLVMAAFIEGVLKAWPDQRILVVTHVRELIAQNHAEMIGLWPEAPAGIYSAGLGKREAQARILFAGIQSIHRRAYAHQQCDLVLIDEAHLIPAASNTMYRRFLDTLARINPQLKVIGFTATPYRTGSGMLHEGKGALFTDIAYEVSVRQLIDDGYLCPLVSKAAETRLDVSGVGSRGGEFIPGQLQAAVDLPEVTEAAIDEVVRLGADRRSWLAFCAGVEHATHVAEAIRARGISAATIFGDTPKPERDRIIAAFKRGEIRALASMGVLTTGFNAPGVDLIAMLRPTKSTGLYVQMAGRGTRLAPGKADCLVLDFAGNVARHGPIDAVKPKKPGAGEGGAPSKVCPDCQSILATAVRVCPDCGHAFPPPKVAVEAEASTLAILTTGKPQWLAVDGVSLPPPREAGRPDHAAGRLSVRPRSASRVGLLRAHRLRSPEGRRLVAPARPRICRCPPTVTEALARSASSRRPTEIAVRPSGRFTEIVSVRFDPCSQASAPSATASRGASAGSTRISPSADPRRDTQPASALQPRLPGHLSPETRHDRPHPERRGRDDGRRRRRRRVSRIPRPIRSRDAQPRRMAAADRDRGHRLLRHAARARGPGRQPARRHGGKDPLLMTDQSFMERFGPRLVANGHPILPIMPGTKKPGRWRKGAWSDYPDWTRHAGAPTTEHELDVWRRWPDAGVGVVCGRIVAVDIDIEDPGWRWRSSGWRASGWAKRQHSASAARRNGCWSIGRPSPSPASGARRSRCWDWGSSSSRMRSIPTPASPMRGPRRAWPISTSAICR